MGTGHDLLCFSVFMDRNKSHGECIPRFEYLGGNINQWCESKRVEAQSYEDTLKEATGVLRDMFGPEIPIATDILVPRWWNNRFQRGSYSNYPIISNNQVVNDIKAPVGRIFFTGEHTSERFNGYVHGGYLAGIDTRKEKQKTIPPSRHGKLPHIRKGGRVVKPSKQTKEMDADRRICFEPTCWDTRRGEVWL
ncbi:hypothetical protein F3Y22_tig00111850pilonHSYRG00010 [Hibiscus syriacus]|uniref:Amine oxidase domain-containing protein n=1 Tax=Hibiscus syriacus TaxID=106335 RepID=A0A6A2Y6Y7_HIBSY|nr:hypothetical protein F3Y22_tig00111850pilonHSYRG00010 [Hibiscus syriacus]